MKRLTAWVMLANAALFFFGALQHAGIAVGPFHEPYIIHATIVEAICGLALLFGAVALFRNWKKSWGIALTGNLVALAGVALGIVALALGAGPRTPSNDLYHRIMLVLIAGATGALVFQRSRRSVHES
jgi:4-amino-4-deoxy-L-arabinose transferase-like glycosyltransferase